MRKHLLQATLAGMCILAGCAQVNSNKKAAPVLTEAGPVKDKKMRDIKMGMQPKAIGAIDSTTIKRGVTTAKPSN